MTSFERTEVQLRQPADNFRSEIDIIKLLRGSNEQTVRAGADPVQNARNAQDAVDRAARNGGGTVVLTEGIYNGILTVKGDNITIKSPDRKAIFDMGGNRSPARNDAAISVQGKNVTIDGITVQNWKPQNGETPVIGIDVKDGSEKIRLRNLHIQGLGTEGTGGPKSRWGAHAIRVTSSGRGINDIVIDNAKINDLKLGQHEAISFMADGGDIRNPKVINSSISAINNIGIVFEGSHRGAVVGFEVSNNVISDARSRTNKTYNESSAAGIQVDTNVQGGKIFNNLIQNSDHGVILESEKGGAVRNIDIANNIFRNNQIAHVFADGSHNSGIAVDGATVRLNRYTTGSPLLAKDAPSRIRNVVDGDNRPMAY